MILRTITLKQLYRMARRDARFFNRLVKDPRRTLLAKGVALSPKSMRRLEQGLKKVYRLSGREFAKLLMLGAVKPRPWPILKPWPGGKPGPWP